MVVPRTKYSVPGILQETGWENFTITEEKITNHDLYYVNQVNNEVMAYTHHHTTKTCTIILTYPGKTIDEPSTTNSSQYIYYFLCTPTPTHKHTCMYSLLSAK